MKDYSEEEMPGWRETFMGQFQDWDGFKSASKIEPAIDDLKEFLRDEYSLLDVGCFVGHLFKKLNHRYYTGIDIDDRAICLARQNAPGVDFRRQDFMTLDGVWDVVWCSRVLLHIPNTVAAIRKLISLARRKCVIVTSVGKVDAVSGDGRDAYWRTVSHELLSSIGPYEFRKRQPYSTLIFEGTNNGECVSERKSWS